MWCYEILPKILNMSLTGSIVILAVLMIRFFLKRAPKLFSYMLWAVVLFRLLCPVSFSSEWSALGVFNASISSSGAVEYISPNIVHTENPSVTLPLPGISEAINNTLPSGEKQLVADPLEAPVAIATNIWIFGIAGMLVCSFINLIKLRRKLVGAVLLRENIYLADHIGSAFVLGIFFPKIYLPSTLSENEQGYILQHEKCHIRRGDHMVKILAFAALCIHWFNPLVWMAFMLAGKDMEMSCDEAVMRKMGNEIRSDYAQSLLHLTTGRRIIGATPLAFGEGNTKDRIKNVLNYKKPTFWIITVAVVALIVVTVCFLSNPKGASISFANIQITWAKTMDLREDTPVTHDLNSAELDELKYRLRDLKIGRQNDDYEGMTPLCSLSIQAQQTPQFMIAEYSDDGSHTVLLYENTYYQLNDSTFSEYLSATCAGKNKVAAKRSLSIDNVLELSQKGMELGWADFDDYAYTETGSGLYIRVYAIDEQFSLWIGGGSTDEVPMYIRLIANENQDVYIDIRSGNVESYIAEHQGTVSTVGGVDAPVIEVNNKDRRHE